MSQIKNSLFIIEDPFIIGFLEIIGVQNQIPIRLGNAFRDIKVSKVRRPTLHTRISNL